MRSEDLTVQPSSQILRCINRDCVAIFVRFEPEEAYGEFCPACRCVMKIMAAQIAERGDDDREDDA